MNQEQIENLVREKEAISRKQKRKWEEHTEQVTLLMPVWCVVCWLAYHSIEGTS